MTVEASWLWVAIGCVLFWVVVGVLLVWIITGSL